MKNAIILLAVAGATSAAFGQTGSMTWEVSTDGGASWAGGLTSTPNGSVLVRAVAAWEGVTALGFAGSTFDVVCSGMDGNAVVNPGRVAPAGFSSQTLAATDMGGGVTKIDDSRDTSAPGAGTRGVNPSQGVPDFYPPFSTANPIVLFQFELTWDGVTQHTVDVGNIFQSTQPTRAISLYTTGGGGQAAVSIANARVNGAQIEFVPAPGALALLGLGGLVAGRRRR